MCNNSNCLYCPHIDKSGRAISVNTNHTYIIPQHTSCRLNNLIYLITCTKCGLQYVGQTICTLNKSLYNHFRDIKHATDPQNAPPSVLPKPFTRVGKHFAHHSHSKMDVKVQILVFIRRKPHLDSTEIFRKSRERHWIYRLRSLEPIGLNNMDDVKNSLAAEEQSGSS